MLLSIYNQHMLWLLLDCNSLSVPLSALISSSQHIFVVWDYQQNVNVDFQLNHSLSQHLFVTAVTQLL